MTRLLTALAGLVLAVGVACPALAGGVSVQEYTLEQVFQGHGFAALVSVTAVDRQGYTITGTVQDYCAQPGVSPQWAPGATDTFAIHEPISSDDPAEWVQTAAHWRAVPLWNLGTDGRVWLTPHTWGRLEILPDDPETARKLRWFCQEDWQARYAAQTPPEQLAADLADRDLKEPAWLALAAPGIPPDVRAGGVIASRDEELIDRLTLELDGQLRTAFLVALVEEWTTHRDRAASRAITGVLGRSPIGAARAELLALFMASLDLEEPHQRRLEANMGGRVREWLESPEGGPDAPRFVDLLLGRAARRGSYEGGFYSHVGGLLDGADLDRWVTGLLARSPREDRFDVELFDAAAEQIRARPRASWAAPLAAIDCTNIDDWSLRQDTIPRHAELLLGLVEGSVADPAMASAIDRLKVYRADESAPLTEEQRARIDGL